jgi:predicted DNA-binding protein (MmcQ/YjbR family)
MNLEEIRKYCLLKSGVTENFPFDNQTLVFKVGGKMFLLTDVDNTVSINVKCDPELAVELREKYDTITPGYHMNKKHWNTIAIHGNYPKSEFFSWIDISYDLVFNSLPEVVRKSISDAQI